MDVASADVVNAIWLLLPGFLAAWIFYGLTAHKRESPFERTIQALIFTAIVQVPTGVIHTVWPKWLPLWTPTVQLGWSLLFATMLGLFLAWCANNNWFHKQFYKFGFTTRTSYPSEWYSTLNTEKRYIILHLKDGRRLYGWPYEWPDHCDSGHFVLMQAEWILDDNTCAPLYAVERFLIPSNDVAWIEFLKAKHEMTASAAEIEGVEELLIGLQEKEDDDGNEATTTAADKQSAAVPARRGTRHERTPACDGRTATNLPATATTEELNDGRQA